MGWWVVPRARVGRWVTNPPLRGGRWVFWKTPHEGKGVDAILTGGGVQSDARMRRWGVSEAPWRAFFVSGPQA